MTTFKSGHPGGPGRARGSRNRLSKKFLDALLADFEEGGAAAIKICRLEDPVRYTAILASILPREMSIETVAADLGDDDLDALIERLKTELIEQHKVTPKELEFHKPKDYSANVD